MYLNSFFTASYYLNFKLMLKRITCHAELVFTPLVPSTACGGGLWRGLYMQVKQILQVLPHHKTLRVSTPPKGGSSFFVPFCRCFYKRYCNKFIDDVPLRKLFKLI